MNISIIANLSFFFILFPYVALLKTPSDIQPNALAVALVFIISYILSKKEIRLQKAHYAILIGLSFPAVFFIFSVHEGFLNALRSYFRYVSLFVFLITGYLSKRYISYKLFFISIFIWFISGFFEVIFRLNILPVNPASLIISDYRTDSVGRGLTSLAVEPSYYGIMCFYFLILNAMFYRDGFYDKRAYWIMSCILLVQIMSSLSGISYLLMMVWLLYLLVEKMGSFYGFIRLLLFFIVLVPVLILMIPDDSRIGSIIAAIATNGFLAVGQLDASVSSRVAHLVLSLKGFWDSFPFGNGFNSFERYIADNRTLWDSIVRVSWDGSIGNEIMSGLGAVLYEIGIVGLMIIVLSVLPVLITNAYYSTLALLCLIPLITSTPISLPVVFFTIGMLSVSRQHNILDKE